MLYTARTHALLGAGTRFRVRSCLCMRVRMHVCECARMRASMRVCAWSRAPRLQLIYIVQSPFSLDFRKRHWLPTLTIRRFDNRMNGETRDYHIAELGSVRQQNYVAAYPDLVPTVGTLTGRVSFSD